MNHPVRILFLVLLFLCGGHVVLLMEQRGPGVHRRRRELSWTQMVGAGVRLGFAKMVEHDLPMVAAVSLLAFGSMANLLAAFGWMVLSNKSAAWMFSGVGTLAWLFALGIFVIFPPTASPRHSDAR